MQRDIYNKFVKVIKQYDARAFNSPIDLKQILILAEFQLGYTDYSNEDLHERLVSFCDRIDVMTKKDSNSIVFLQNAVLQLIDAQFSYNIEFVDMTIKASHQTLSTEEKDQEEYWLTSWHPSRVIEKDVFIHELRKSEEIWKEVSADLRKALKYIVFMPPYSDSHNYFDELRTPF